MKILLSCVVSPCNMSPVVLLPLKFDYFRLIVCRELHIFSPPFGSKFLFESPSKSEAKWLLLAQLIKEQPRHGS
jgi:hypothetical protein